MAAVEVTISGVLFDKVNRTTQPVVLIGEASLTGLGVGGGPIPPGGGSGGQPPTIWPGPGPLPHPEHPIHIPWPGDPGYSAPPSWGPPPTEPPKPPSGAGGNWEWCWSPGQGWHAGFVPGDKPQPIPPPGGGNGGTTPPPDTGKLPPTPTHPIAGVPEVQPVH